MSNDTRTPNVRNITRLFRTATTAQIVAGTEWYADAHEVATALAVKNGVTIEVSAGVLAAVSPLNSWGANVNLAGRILAAKGHAVGGGLPANIAKANAIILTGDALSILSGDKVRNFYLSIVTRGAEGVTIDRHAWSLAVNHRYAEGNIPSLKGKRYTLAVDAYTRAARILSAEYEAEVTPAQVQAVTWVLWRAKYWAEGAWDAHESI